MDKPKYAESLFQFNTTKYQNLWKFTQTNNRK